MLLDATKIAPKLYQGSAPRQPYALRRQGFQTVVLCAQELRAGQPAEHFHQLEVIRAPIDDALRPPTRAEHFLVQRAGRMVAERIRDGRRCLVTCAAGRNRSGLVIAHALRQLNPRVSMPAIIAHVQRIRRDALSNPFFVEYLARLG